MTDTSVDQNAGGAVPHRKKSSVERTFLVIVDDSDELERALYFACRRARSVDGRVILLYCKEGAQQGSFMRFMGIGERLEEEARETAEQLLYDLSEKVFLWSKKHAVVLIEDEMKTAMPKLLGEGGISIIISPMPSKNSTASVWASYLLNQGAEEMRIPVTMVPASMTIDEINKLT